MHQKTQLQIQQDIVDASVRFEKEQGSPNYLYLGSGCFLDTRIALETGFFVHYQGKSYDSNGWWITPSQIQCMHAIVDYDECLTIPFEWRF